MEIIKVQHYLRDKTALHDFPFVPTSPAIQNIQTAMLYPGMGLLEGINVNEGRGTATPFTIFGAPFIDARDLLKTWEQKNIPGIATATISYTPNESVYAGVLCHGLQFTLTNADTLRPVAMGIALIQTLLQLYPDKITERLYPTAANPGGGGHLDKLLGIPDAFEKLRTGHSIDIHVLPAWEKVMLPYLLY